MSTSLYDPQRRTVPRWRLWRDAVRLGDVDVARQVRTPQRPTLEGLAKAEFEWQSHRSVPFAGDFIGRAYALGEGSAAKDAAEFILKMRSAAGPVAQALAARILAEANPSQTLMSEPPPRSATESRGMIHRLRASLRQFHRDPLTCMDLAREYVAIGDPESALRPVEIALALAPHSRFILRSASRFFLHISDPERAHDILRRAEILESDPWVVAAEIAVAGAAGRTSSLVKAGSRSVESGAYPPAHLSELASAIGTLELEAGKMRVGRRHFRRALERPTENVVAQAGWVSRQIGDLGLDPRVLDTPRSYEARSWAGVVDGRWEDSLRAAELWLRDEPFASRPAVFGSWAALATGSDYPGAVRIASEGLRMHPAEFFLANNLAVALAYMGKSAEALGVFSEIKPRDLEESKKATYLATKGLIEFRLGEIDEGRRLYRAAVVDASTRGDVRAVVAALLHFAREEFRYNPPTAEALVKEACDSFAKLSKVEQVISRRFLELVRHG
jgi:tetratricopeptide (TPR) repeat protein